MKKVEGKKKKETMQETAIRLEDKNKMEVKFRMRSELWRQRREKDGKLVMVWKEINQIHQQMVQESPKTSLMEDANDQLLEELILTDMERQKLQELETWYSTTNLKLT